MADAFANLVEAMLEPLQNDGAKSDGPRSSPMLRLYNAYEHVSCAVRWERWEAFPWNPSSIFLTFDSGRW